MNSIRFVEYEGQLIYRDASHLSNMAIYSLKVIQALLFILFFVLILNFNTGNNLDLNSNYSINNNLSFFVLILILVPIFFFTLWLFQAYKNLRPLGVEKLNYESKWAYLGVIVPIFNFFVPFFITVDTWFGSQKKDSDRSLHEESETINIPNSLILWWIISILSIVVLFNVFIIYQVLSAQTQLQYGIDFSNNIFLAPYADFVTSHLELIVSGLVNELELLSYLGLFIGAQLTIEIIKDIQTNQIQRYEELTVKNLHTRKPVCPRCNAELRSRQAKQCPVCFLNWHDPLTHQNH